MGYEVTLDREYRSRILEVAAWCRFNIGDGGWLKDSDDLWNVSEAFGHHIFTFKNEADMVRFFMLVIVHLHSNTWIYGDR